MTEEQIQRKAEIASFSRKELNAHAFHLEQEQNDYEFIIHTLQQQQKQLIEAMDRASDLLSHNHNAYHYLQDALQQIERNDEES